MCLYSFGEKGDREKLRENDCRDSFRADSKTVFFLERFVAFTKNMINKSLHCLKNNSGAQRCCVCVARLIIAMTTNQAR